MARKSEATVEQVKALVDQWEREGRAPGVVPVMRSLGVSHPVARRLLDEVQAERLAAAAAEPAAGAVIDAEGPVPAVLAPVVDGLVAAWHSVVAAERARIDGEIAAAWRTSDERIAAAKRETAALAATLAETEARVGELEAERDEVARAARRAEGRATKAEAEAAHLREALAELRGRLSEREAVPSAPARPRPTATAGKPGAAAAPAEWVDEARRLKATGLSNARVAETMTEAGHKVSSSWVQKVAGGAAAGGEASNV